MNALGLMLVGKHGAMPAFMGLVLLTGIIVNSGILLIDFAKCARTGAAQ